MKKICFEYLLSTGIGMSAIKQTAIDSDQRLIVPDTGHEVDSIVPIVRGVTGTDNPDTSGA